MRPSGTPAEIIRFAPSRAVRIAPLRLIASVRSISSSEMSVTIPAPSTPAFAITVSIVPNAPSAASKPATICASVATSISTASAASPISVARDSSLSLRRAARATCAPEPASSRAKRAPRPDDAPVTSALRPERSKVKSAMSRTLCLRQFPVDVFHQRGLEVPDAAVLIGAELHLAMLHRLHAGLHMRQVRHVLVEDVCELRTHLVRCP